MAKDDEDLIEQATPKEEDGMKVPTRSTADPDIDTEARGRAMSLDNMQIDPADVEFEEMEFVEYTVPGDY